jgi:hypothetical protein
VVGISEVAGLAPGQPFNPSVISKKKATWQSIPCDNELTFAFNLPRYDFSTAVVIASTPREKDSGLNPFRV